MRKTFKPANLPAQRFYVMGFNVDGATILVTRQYFATHGEALSYASTCAMAACAFVVQTI